MIRLATALFLLPLLVAGAAAAAPPPKRPLPLFRPDPHAPLPKGSPISVHFAPPLGAPIRYRWEEVTGGATYAGEFVVRFEKDAAGYSMRASAEAAGGELPARLRLALQPVRLRLDRDGPFTAIADADPYWSASDALLGELRAEPRYAKDAPRLDVQWQGFRKLDPVTAAYAAAQAYAPVTLMSRLEVTLGSKVQIQAHPGYNSALPEERLTRSIVFNPAYASPNRLRMEVTAEYDASSSRRIAERLGGPAAVARLDAPGAKVVERTVHEVEPATGLTLYHEDRYQLVGGGAEFPLRTVRVTRLDRPEVK